MIMKSNTSLIKSSGSGERVVQSSLRLPLGLEAPVMTLIAVIFLSLSKAIECSAVVPVVAQDTMHHTSSTGWCTC